MSFQIENLLQVSSTTEWKRSKPRWLVKFKNSKDKGKMLKATRGGKKWPQRIRNQNNMWLLSSNTESQKTLREWFQHFNRRKHDFQHKIFYKIKSNFIQEPFLSSPHLLLLFPALSADVMAVIQQALFDHQDHAWAWRNRKRKQSGSLMTFGATITAQN